VHVRRLVAVLAGIALAGAGVAVGTAATGHPPPKLQIDSVGCTESAAPGGHHVHGSCTYTLTDGRRFRCPLSFSNRHQTPASVQNAKQCHALKPIRIPPSWQRVFTHMYAVQTCLSRRGIRASGGPYFAGNPRKTPIGELVASNRGTAAFIAFYIDAATARRAEPAVLENVRRGGGAVERRGSVTVAWTSRPSRRLRAPIDGCAF